MQNNPLPRLDSDSELRQKLLPFCRLRPGEVWVDPRHGHKVGCLDATDRSAIQGLVQGERINLAIQDPPYNVAALERKPLQEYVEWSRQWVALTFDLLAENSSLYVWLGADQNEG